MHLLSFYQGYEIINVGLFISIEKGRSFVKQIPGYNKIKEGNSFYEYLDPDFLPEYMELTYLGNIYPITKYMFLKTSKVDIIWQELTDFSKIGEGIIKGSTRVDAYSINNKDVHEYIEKREKQYCKVKTFLASKNIEADRSFFGSEDGEAIIYRKNKTDSWHFLTHMDPLFVEEENIQAVIKNMLML